STSERPDPEIARAAVNALEWNILVPHDRLKVTVEKGWVTLEGEVDYYYQAEEAERSVRHLTGVKGATNLITVRSQPTPSVEAVKRRIKAAPPRVQPRRHGRHRTHAPGDSAQPLGADGADERGAEPVVRQHRRRGHRPGAGARRGRGRGGHHAHDPGAADRRAPAAGRRGRP